MRPDQKKTSAPKKSGASLSTREKKEQKRREQLKFEKKLLVISLCVLAAALVVAGFFSLCSSGFFSTRASAVTVGGHSVSPVVYDYFYEDTYNSFCSTYGSYLSYLFDASKPLDQQYYDQDNKITWADHFRELTLEAVRQTYALCDEAEKNGFQIGADTQKEIDDAIYYIGLYADYYKYDSSDAYLVSRYGKGATVDTYREYATATKTADAYGEQYKASLSFSDEKIEDYYAQNKKLFDTVTYRTYAVAVKAGDTVDLAASQALAQKIADECGGDEDKFSELVLANADDPDYYKEADRTIRTDFTYANAPKSLADWLFDEGRQPGDVTVAENGDNGWFVSLWLSRNTHDYPMRDLRSIRVAVSDFSDETAVRLAQENAGEILQKYTDGDKTEDSFAALAKSYGSDAGGLQENVYKGQLKGDLDAWLYDEGRQPGDTAVVKGEDGFYVVYYSGTGDNCRTDTVREALVQNAYQDWYGALSDAAKFKTHWFGLKLVLKEPLKTNTGTDTAAASNG
jgi:hypothetical protein